MKYVIVQISGKQLLCKPNEFYNIDYIKNIYLGDFILLNKVLLYKNNKNIQIGFPYLQNLYIIAQIIKQIKGSKMTILKTKPKKKYTRIKGYRPLYTQIKILSNSIS